MTFSDKATDTALHRNFLPNIEENFYCFYNFFFQQLTSPFLIRWWTNRWFLCKEILRIWKIKKKSDISHGSSLRIINWRIFCRLRNCKTNNTAWNNERAEICLALSVKLGPTSHWSPAGSNHKWLVHYPKRAHPDVSVVLCCAVWCVFCSVCH